MIKRGRGFILVLVLWVLAAMTIAASAFSVWISNTTRFAIQIGDEREAQIERFATLESIKFLLASHPSRASGLIVAEDPQQLVRQWLSEPLANHRIDGSASDLRFDGTWYRGLGSVVFSIQDESGLIGLNRLRADHAGTLLGQFGINPFQRRRLIDNLVDYGGLHGNPARDVSYRSAGLPVPPRRELLVPGEARWVLGWHALDSLWDNQRWQKNTSTIWGGVLNLNAASETVLASVPEIGPGPAAVLLERREQLGYVSIMDAERIVGRSFDPLTFMLVSGEALRVTMADPVSNRATSHTLELTARSPGVKPWRVHSTQTVYGPGLDYTSTRTVEHALLAPSQAE